MDKHKKINWYLDYKTTPVNRFKRDNIVGKSF